LANRGILEKIIRFLKPAQYETVIEIGAGLGHLTALLGQAETPVIAIERDAQLKAHLSAVAARGKAVKVVIGDARRLSAIAAITDAKRPLGVVGNLPFGCATEILFEVLRLRRPARKAVLMFQKEVADRLCAPPHSRQYGALTVNCRAQCALEPLFSVKAGSFYPRPEVDATVLAIQPFDPPRLDPCCLQTLRTLVQGAFGGRRKMFRNALKHAGLWNRVQQIGSAVTPLQKLRPQDIAPCQYISLAQALCRQQGHR
jgi:16S rRNA (adenine1518-N6/adenine1519-N6)-dimethyltransferase